MPVTVNHQLSATTPDDPLYEIKPSNWNSGHAVTFNAVGSEISGAFGNGGGVTFGLSADGKITAAAPAGGITNINVSAGTVSNNLSAFEFNNGGGVSFGLTGSTITASVQTNYLTTAMVSNAGSNFVQAAAAFNGTNASGTIASNGISVSVAAPVAQTAFVFSNANGVTFGTNGSTVTASVATNYQSQGAYLTTARASNDAIGLNSALTANGVSVTANSSGLSLNFPAFLTTAAQSNHSHGNPTLNLTNLSGTTASNSAGFTLSLSAGNYLTTARASNDAVGLATAQSNATWTVNSAGLSFDGRNYAGTGLSLTNATATLNSNGLQLSVAGGGVINQTGPNIQAGTDSLFTSGTVTFGNAFNGSFVTSNGSVVYSNAFLTTAAQSGHSHGNPTLNLTNLSGTTASNSAGFTLSLSAGAGGGAATIGDYEIFPLGNNSTFSSMGQNSIYFQKFIPVANVSFNNIERRMSGSTVSSALAVNCNYTLDYGLYSRGTGASTSIYSAIATSQLIIRASYSSNLSAGYTISQGAASYTSSSAGTVVLGQLTGFRHLYLGMTNTITAGGEYGIAMRMSSATTGNTGAFRFSLKELTMINNLTIGKLYATTVNASNASYVGDFAQGVYSATSSNLPNTIGITGFTNAVSQARQYIQLEV
jgi:hypothetical protein